MLLVHFLVEIRGGPSRQNGVGFDGRGKIGLSHQTPTPTPKKLIGAGARQKVKSPSSWCAGMRDGCGRPHMPGGAWAAANTTNVLL
jgi:hypothetical protein